MIEKRKIRLLFIGHEASLTGAPVLLINLLKLLHESDEYEVKLVIVRDGPLVREYQKIYPCLVLKPEDYGNEKNIFRKVFNYLRFNFIVKKLRREAIVTDIIFSNTITNGRILSKLKSARKPVITYVHELQSVISYYDRFRDSELSFSNSRLFLAPSKAVAENLTIPDGDKPDVEYLNYYFPLPADEGSDREQARINFAKKHKIPLSHMWVVGMGAASHRKGFDLFAKTAIHTRKLNADISFIWVGDYGSKEDRAEFNCLLAKEDVILTGYLEYDIKNLLPFDLFFLSSREDPYPLVVIEAAYMRLPTIYFAGSGGIVEFISQDAGWKVDGFSYDSAAILLDELVKSPEEILNRGKVAREKAINLHSNATLVLSQFNSAVLKVIR